MFRVMLCGASDTAAVSEEFCRVVRAAGGDPWHYLDGKILYLNNATASFARNSAQTVRTADIVVFVMVERFGQIAWETELRQALDDGKPMIILCEAAIYQRFIRQSEDLDERMRQVLTELEVDRSLSVIAFTQPNFGVQLQRQLARHFHLGLAALQTRNRRQTLAGLLGDAGTLTSHDLAVAREIALDELEDKVHRKQAVRALALTVGLDPESIEELAGSHEQGVARLTLTLLGDLHRQRPLDHDLVAALIELCNAAEDVGLARRLVVELLRLDAQGTLPLLAHINYADAGLRRRVATALDERWDELATPDRLPTLIDLLRRCVAKTGSEASWLTRAKDRLKALDAPRGETQEA